MKFHTTPISRIGTLLIGFLLTTVAHASTPFSLEEGYRSAFHIGAALGEEVYVNQSAILSPLARNQFDLIVSGNDFKWERIHPREGVYDFSRSDAMMEWAESHGKTVHGHVLVWHSQTPSWVFQNSAGGDLTRAELIDRMQAHIRTVVGRYKGRIQSWDVVNEAFNDDGTLRDSKWRQIIGDDYLEIAFRTAHEVDPDAILVYNDYSWAAAGRRAAILAMAADFKARGVPISGLGIQGHWQLSYPSAAQVDMILADAASTGLHVLVTELDIDVLPTAWEHAGADISNLHEYQDELDPYTEGLPADVAIELAQRYQTLFGLFLKYQSSLYTVTLWGVTDGDSWLNNFPVRGRTNYPMIFDREGLPKSAYYRVLSIAPDTFTPTTQSVEPYQPIALHRFARPANNSHFFTANPAEYEQVLSFVEKGIFVYDGISHHVVGNHTLQSQPVYRLYNRLSGSHFYTAIRDEMLQVLANPNRIFSYEGVAFYVFLVPEIGTQPVYRFYAPPTGSHFFTISEAEKNILQASMPKEQLSYDGVAWYAYP